MKKIISFLIITTLIFSTVTVFAENSHTITYNENVITITGFVPSKSAGVAVNLLVLKPGKTMNEIQMENPTGTIEHFNNVFTGENGVYTFKFNLDANAYSNKYLLRIGCEEFAAPIDDALNYYSEVEIKDLITELKKLTTPAALETFILTTKDDGSTYGEILSLDTSFYTENKLTAEQKTFVNNEMFKILNKLDPQNTKDSVDLLLKTYSSNVATALSKNVSNATELDKYIETYGTTLKLDTTRYSLIKSNYKDLIAKEFSALETNSENIAAEFSKTVAKIEINNVATNKTNMQAVVEHYASNGTIDVDITSASYSKYKSQLHQNLLSKRPFASLKDFEAGFKKELSSLSNVTPPSGGGGSLPSTGGGGAPVIISPVQTPAPTPTPTPDIEVFSDLDDVPWASKSINHLYNLKIITGDNGKFYPNNNITREEFVKIVVSAFDLKMEGTSPNFTDVDDSDWYAQYVNIAFSNGVVSGKSETEFGTGQNITREEMATIINRILIKKKIELANEIDKKVFVDDKDISEYAKDGVYLLQQANIISGYESGEFLPKNNITRAESAKIISLILEKM